MENLNEEPEYSRVYLFDMEAEQFAKPFWRNATEEELEEIAHFIASDYVSAEKRHFDPDMDDIEMLIMFQNEKKESIRQLRNLTRVLDMPGINATIFFTLNLHFTKTDKTNTLRFEDGLIRYLKKDGVLSEIDSTLNVIFEL